MTAPIIPTELIAPVYNPATFGLKGNRELIHNIFTQLRRDIPLGIAEVPGYDPHWIVTKYDDVREITRQDNLFHSADRSKTLASQIAEKMMRDYSGMPTVFKTLVHMDEPEHMDHRAVTQPLFYPQNIAKLEESIRATACRYVDEMLAMGPELDFATQIAFRYPCEVICTLLGVPKEDHGLMLDLTHWLFTYADPDLCRPGADLTKPEEIIKTWEVVYEKFRDYYLPMVEARRKSPTGDITSVIANGQVNGQPMNERNLLSYLIIASTAGHDTTANTTGTGMWVLAEQPGLLKQLQDNPKLIPGFVEETIRWASPVQHFIRSAVEDYELRGQKIKKGDLIYVSYVSANRDEDVFKDPFTFDPTRAPNRHIGFGYGNHNCIGQHLARMEMRVLWEELIPKLASVEFAGEPKMAESEFVCGPKYVPIRYTLK